MKCLKCGKEIVEGTLVCLNCGNRIIEIPRSIGGERKRNSKLIEYLVSIFILFIFASIAIQPRLENNRGPQYSEAKQNLGAIFTAYTTYHNDNGTYPTSTSIQIGNVSYNCLQVADWAPTGRLRYNYECMGVNVYWPKWDTGGKPSFPRCPGVITGATKDSFTVAACGTIDNDPVYAPFLDVWTIDDAKNIRRIANDRKVPKKWWQR